MEGAVAGNEPTEQVPRRKRNKILHDIPKAAFDRLVREICHENRYDKTMWQPEALEALHDSCEQMLGRRFVHAQRLADLCRMETVNIQHWENSDPSLYTM